MRPRIKIAVENGNVSIINTSTAGLWNVSGVKVGSSNLSRREYARLQAKRVPCNRRSYDYAQGMANHIVSRMFAN